MSKVIVVGTNGQERWPFGSPLRWPPARPPHFVIVATYEPVPFARLSAVSRDVPADLAWAINRHEALLATAWDQAAADNAAQIRTVAVQGGPARAIAGVANAGGADVVMIGQGLRAGGSRRLARSLSRRGGCAAQVSGRWTPAVA